MSTLLPATKDSKRLHFRKLVKFNQCESYEVFQYRKLNIFYRPVLLLFFFLCLGFSTQAQIAQRGSSTTATNATASATLTINKPTGVVAGDLMIVSIVQNETDNDNGGLNNVTATGWTLIDGRIIFSEGTGNGQNAWHGTVLYRVAGASEGASYSFTLPNSRADMAIGSIVAFSGVNTTGGFNADGSVGGPFDVDPGTLNLANSATATAITLNTNTTNAAVVMIGMVNNDRTYSGWAATNPNTLTELFDNVTMNGDDASVGAAWALKPTTGATGNGTVTLSASDRNAAILLALRPICNTVGSASSNPTLCANTPLTNITHTTTGATGIGTATNLPAGLTAAFASNTITISGTPTSSGTFNYSIPLTGGCGSVNATGTITVLNSTIDYANLQFPGSQTICVGNNLTAFGRIYEAGVTEAAGANPIIEAQIGYNSTNTNPNTWAAGNWTNATYNVQSGNNDEYVGSFGSALAAGTYFYAFRYRMNGCAWQYGGFNGTGGGFYNGSTNNNGVLTISPNNTVGSASSTPTLCINTPLTNITHTTTGATGIGAATGLPAGVTPAFASNTITISGTPTASGTFNYSIPLTGGCGTVNATGTITVTPANTITLTSAVGTNAQLRCINTAITNITYATTGATGASFSGLPPGVNGAWAAGVATISGTPNAYGVYNYTVTLTGGCGSVTATGSINVNGLDYGNLQFPGTQTICAGTNFTAFGQVYEPGITEAAGANVNIVAQIGYHTTNSDPSTWPAGNWTAATYNVQSGNNDEYSASFGSALAVGTYYYTFRYSINGCSWQYAGAFAGFWNGTTNVNGVLTVSPAAPAQPGAITGTATQCPALTAQTYSIAAVTNATTYNWTVPTGWTITAGAGTTSITVTTGTTGQNGNISVTAQNSCGTSTARTLAVTVSPAAPSQPAAITGTATQCPALTAQTYSIAAVTNATTYNWTAPTGWTITAGAGTTSITVTTGAAGQNGNISVTAQNSCGTSTASTLAVTVSPATPAQPGTITGVATKCPGLTGQVYSIAAVTNATTYNWTVPTGWTITAGAGTTSITVTTGSAGQNGNISVTAQNSCGTSTARTLAVTVSPAAPSQPAAITGTATQCPGLTGQTYSIAAVTNATTYNWTLPTGWSITAGAGTTSITVATGSAGQNGNISVTAQNSCGTSTAQTLAVTVSPATPLQPSLITGTATQCPALTSQTYSIPAVTNATTYNWTVPTGWSITAGAGTTSITVTTGATGQNGSISVTAQNSCGTSAARTLAVTVSPAAPAQPGAITGVATKCPGLTGQVYSIAAVTNATTYNWTVPTGWAITAGAGTASITVTTGSAGQNGNISVSAQNSCGTSTAQTLAVTVSPATPLQPSLITGTATQCPALTSQTYSIPAVTNATTYNWTVPTGWSITAGAGTTSITVTTGTTGQNGNISVTAQNSCGTSSARTLAVTVSPATPAQPGAIAGLATKCPGLTGQTYSIAAVTNATTYNWTVPTGWSITAGAGTTSITVTTGSAGQNGNISVTAQNSCGTSTARTLAVTVSPATPVQPGAISGTANQCATRTGQVYSIAAVANATSYNWTVPTGWTITANTGTSITVTTGNGGQNGNITVTAQNSCGTSSASTLAVTVTPDPTVNVGPGLAAICQGGVSANLGGSVTSPATGGTWSTTSGGTFSPSATTLNATWTPPAGFVGTATLTLTSSGGSCGIVTGSKNITVNPLPSTPSSITGTAAVCQGQTGVVYSVPAIANATSYSWSYSGTGFTASGSTASIFGSFSASATSGVLTVRGVNSCGNGPVSASFAITISSAPAAAGTITGSSSLCQGQTGVPFSVAPIPGATSYLWSYSGTGFTPSGNTASITANFSASATAGILTVRGVNSCGNGVASANFNISLAQLPGTPGTILGPSTVCRGQVGFTFTIPAIANATSYNWVYTGTGITFSGNTSMVTATISNTATSGVLRVRGVSACLNGPFSADFPVNVINAPTVSITSNYCGNPGFVILTASSGFTNYLWSTGANTPFINADIAGQYTVTVANSFGCMATASVGVATELVTNGKFDLGNTGFTTNYNYVADIAGQTEMYPEGTYAVVPNANTVHNLFWGTGRTPSGGPFMVVNGSPALGQDVWSQNNITVQPNTTYYFSAWGMSVVNGNNAALRFSINGSQVGTIAYLPNGYTSTAGPFNWVRFYGSWNSGFATEADLSIINLNTILGGNDFGLDDISFGTLSPVALSVDPGTPGGTGVCQGSELILNANQVGGASPYTFAWTGPNGFTSTDMNPVVTTNATAAVAGTYNVTITDGFGCTASSSFILSVNALPVNKTPVATVATVCANGASGVNIAASQVGVSYQLRNDADDSPVGDPIAGTGGTITFPIASLATTTTYNVLATGNLSQCSVEMPTTVTITVATTPVLNITNQAVCSGTVNLTAAAVTAGSTGSGTLSYWTDAAGTVALSTPSSVSTSGVYYIRSTVGTCSDIEPVSVSISTTPATGFSYPTSPYCSTETDPTATMNVGAVAGVFSCSNAGLVFQNTSTGTIDLSATTAGTYTIQNTVSPTGGCPSVSSTANIVITQAPLTDFSYAGGNDFCQVFSAVNPVPVLGPGAAAGTFASTFGLNFVSTSTGEVDLATSTPGNYAVWNTRPAIGGCLAESDTVFVDINPYVFAGTVTSSVSDDIICLGETVDLFSQTSSYNSVLLRERFNGAINNWVRGNASTGGTVGNAAWTLRPNDYSYNSNNYRSNDNSQFYMSNSQAQGGTLTLTTLRSPVMSTVGYTSLTLDFFHFFDARNSGDTAQVQVSLNNLTWTTVATYTNDDEGGRTSFANPVINLNAYIGQPIFYVRFRYRASNDRMWAIDNVSLTGNCTRYNYNWVSAPAGFTSTAANPINVAPPQNSFYVVNATNTFGCSNPASPVPVTVNALPILTSTLTPPDVCGNEVFLYAPAATPSGTTISWTRPVATGISNAAVTAPQVVNPNETLVNTTNSNKTVIYNFNLDNNGCSQTIPVTLNVKPIPVIDIGSSLNVCNGSPAQLNTTITNGLNVNTYSWSPAIGLSSTDIADPTATLATASQNYTVTVEAANGCTSSSAAVTVSNIGFGGTAGLWLGTQNSNWDDCRNWADGKIPDATTNVTVDANSVNNIQITGSQSCNNLFFQSTTNGTRTITILANASLSVTGNVGLTKSSGTGSITLRVMNNATLTCNNLSVTGSAAGAANAIIQKDVVNSTVVVNGSLSLDPGSVFDMNDNNNMTQDGTLNIKGNFVNNANAADFNVGNAMVMFSGNAMQSITCPANQDFGRITLDNSSTAGVRLNNNIIVSQEMIFVNGVLDLNQRTLTLGTNTVNATVSGSGNNSYILAWDGSDNGTVVHRVNNTGTTYLFPIGDLNEYTPFAVSLTSANLSNATLTGKLYGNSHPNIVSSTNYLGRYWSIEPSGITNPLYNVEYSYSAGDIFGSEAFLFPAKYNSGGWQSCMESASNAMIGNGSVDAGTNTLTWTGITTFSEFTAIGNGTALPIELLEFSAEPTEKVVNLKWVTSSETNNSHFTIERSTDGVTFDKVLETPGAGNSNTVRTYKAVDESPAMGVSYYRLKQTDFNGDFTYSEWVVVNFTGTEEISLESVFADRATGNVFIRCNNPENQNVNVQIFDSGGRIIHSSNQFSGSANWNGSINVGTLSKGTYVVRVSIGGKMLHGRFIF
jgi:hypothetical protein